MCDQSGSSFVKGQEGEVIELREFIRGSQVVKMEQAVHQRPVQNPGILVTPGLPHIEYALRASHAAGDKIACDGVSET
jgi:hypothetical protein